MNLHDGFVPGGASERYGHALELLIKAAAVGIVGALMALVIKKSNPEISLLLLVGAGVLILGISLGIIGELRDIIELAAELAGLSPAVLSPVLKCVGIGIVTRIAVETCRDAGAGSVSAAVELAGAACALFVAAPLIKTLVQMLSGLI